MNKKIVFCMVLVMSLLGLFVRGDSGDANFGSMIDPNVANNINTISVGFCNGTDGLIYMRPGQTKDICMIFSNRSKENVGIIFGFSQGYKSAGTELCDADMSTGNAFAKLVKGESLDNKILVPGLSYATKIVKIKIPKTSSGMIYGCIGYYIDGSVKNNDGGMFNVVIRKAKNIDIDITGSVYNLGWRDSIKENKNPLLEGIIVVCGIYLIRSVVQMTKKKEKHHKKK